MLSAAVAIGPLGAAAEEAYRLGVALALTGTGAPYSREALEGIEIAVQEINAAGGLLGKHRIELFVANTQTRPDVAVTAVRRLIEERSVRAVIGTYSSASAIAIKPICRERRVLHIATVSNSEDITKLDPSPYTFSVVPNTYMMAKATAIATARLAQQRNWRRYVTIASDYAWGRSSQQIQVALLKQMAPELRLEAEYWPPLGTIGFNSFVVAIQNSRPDFVLESVAGTDNALWLRAAHDYRLFDKVTSAGGLLSVTELMTEGKRVHRGRYGRTRAPFFAHLDDPAMQRFVAAYRERYARYPSDWAVMSYDGVHALRQGIEKAKSIASDTVKDAMRGMTLETTRGRLYFRTLDNQLSASAYFGRVIDDPRFPFPIYADLAEFKGPDIWRPEAEIQAARQK